MIYMDRYLRYDRSIDGINAPNIVFKSKIFNKDGKLIGFRFGDVFYPVYIDVPLHNIDNEIVDNIDTIINSDSPRFINFPFFRCAVTRFTFKKKYVEPPVILTDKFREITPGEDEFSILMPKCIFRVMNFKDDIKGSFNLAMNIAHGEGFISHFKTCGIDHLRFIDNDNKVTVWVKTRLEKELMDDDYFEHKLETYANYCGFSKKVLDLRFDKSRKTLVLTVSKNTKFYDRGYITTPNVVERGHYGSDTKFRYGFNPDKNIFFIMPDGGYETFGFESKSTDKFSDDAKVFIETCCNNLVDLDYIFCNPASMTNYLYVGYRPNIGTDFDGINDEIEECLKSKNMDLFQDVFERYFSRDIDFVVRNGVVCCQITRSYEISASIYGDENVEKVIVNIKNDFENYFSNIDTEVAYNRGMGVISFTLFVEV